MSAAPAEESDMGISLHAAFVPSCRQLLVSMARLIDKAEAFCADRKLAPADILEARLADDMHPFAYQVKSTVVHSIGAIEGVRRGSFAPDTRPLLDNFADLKALVEETIAALDAVDPAEVEGFIGRDVRFVAGDRSMEFVAEQFLLSFSQPNFYFHAATAYDILRWKGLSIGKRDFNGRVRVKAAA
jgi:uncharacterized protein